VNSAERNKSVKWEKYSRVRLPCPFQNTMTENAIRAELVDLRLSSSRHGSSHRMPTREIHFGSTERLLQANFAATKLHLASDVREAAHGPG
jgi:hypothetical protein